MYNRCIGFGIYDGICESISIKSPYLWCVRCEKLRREYLDQQFKSLTKMLNKEITETF
jgi:hypothetical protein